VDEAARGPLRLDRLVLLPNDAMRARRCPRAIAALWVWDAALGAVLAWPIVALVRATYGTHPRADAVLWDSGGFALLDLLVRRLPSLSALTSHAAALLLFTLVLGLVPSGAVLVCVGFTTENRRPPSIRSATQAGVVAFLPFAILLATTLALQACIALATVTGASLADEGLQPSLGDALADAVALSVIVIGAVFAAFAGVLEDMARAAVIRFGVGAGEGLRAALRALARRPVVLFWSWAWRGLASVAPIAFGGLLAARLGGRGGTALAVLFAIHQLVVGVRASLRVSWLARAMRAVDAESVASLRPRERAID
jgi:hypothetical protein